MNEVKQIGNYETESTWDNPQTGRVYSVDGLSPTLNTCGGGDRQPKIIIDDTQGFDGTRIYQDMCPTLRSQRSGLMTVEPALHKIGNIYDSKGQNGNIYSNTGISPAISSGTTENKNNGGIGSSNAPKVIVASRGRNPDNPSDRKQGIELEQRLEPNSEGICNTLTSVQKDNLVLETNYRIRKLTPKECWRLMGFTDEDFYKAEEVNSNTQLYKQAGNSIVVKVLEAIFKQML